MRNPELKLPLGAVVVTESPRCRSNVEAVANAPANEPKSIGWSVNQAAAAAEVEKSLVSRLIPFAVMFRLTSLTPV